MAVSHATPPKPLRLWPGVAAAVLLLVSWITLPIVFPDDAVFGMFGAVGFGAVILLWWLFLSRAPWIERIGAIALMVGAVLVAYLFVDRSISNALMGRMLPVFSIPVQSLLLVASLVATRHLSAGKRRAALAAAIVLAAAGFTLVRTGGITGDADPDLHWRWTPTPEERLLAQAADERLAPVPSAAATSASPGGATDAASGSEAARPAAAPTAPSPARDAVKNPSGTASKDPSASPSGERVAATSAAEPPAASVPDAARVKWPGFRGLDRDGVTHGAQIDTDWSASPPAEIWRKPIGPGWSSFAVRGDLIYTQEQRGEDEVVSAYKLATGEPVWRHRDRVRFYESNGGAGPRATPSVANGRVYTMGATGIVNALDAGSGALLWSRNAAADTGKTVPDWGIASSPLVVDDLVIVAVAGQLAAYDALSGRQRWTGQAGGGGYSSPHLARIDGVVQVILQRGARTISVAPADGTLLWDYTSGQPAVSIVQPGLTADGDVLLAPADAMGGHGLHRVAISRTPAGWKAEQRWTTRGLKPYFNDFVVHKGLAFGFDGNILSCIDLNDGARKWKGGRYGNGQMILLPEQDLLLVLSEEGELALVSATGDQFREIARVPAIDGKTWNHPVLVGDTLLVRNGEEMAAFRLSAAGR